MKTFALYDLDLVFTLNSYDDDAEPSSPENPESNGHTEWIVLFSIADAQDAACFILEWSKTGTALTLPHTEILLYLVEVTTKNQTDKNIVSFNQILTIRANNEQD